VSYRSLFFTPPVSNASLLAQHLLVFVMAVVAPLWDRYEIPRLKASGDPRKKLKFYGKVIAAEWTCASVAYLALGLGTLLTIRALPGDIDWLSGSRGKAFVLGLFAAVAVALLVPAILALWSENIRAKAANAARSLSFLIPSTTEERRWWWLLCITAGICEELLYRGFLLHYLHTAPFHLSLTWALVTASFIFGIGHLYQGVKPALATVVLGFALGAVFVVTGSLWIPIVAHAVLDLRVLLLLPAGALETPAALQPEARAS
jgi:membrane protease YdiL (CAAX protease family)